MIPQCLSKAIMTRQDHLSSTLLLSILLLSVLGAVCPASSATPDTDESLLEMFESFLPKGFLEKPVGFAKDAPQRAKSRSAAAKKQQEALKTAHTMLDGLKNIVEGLNAPDNGDCVFKCSNGATPKSNPGFKPVPNGCGSHGLKVDVSDMPGIGACCNQHDICYGTCGSGQAACDQKFNACMADACVAMRNAGTIKNDKKLKECEAVGVTFHLTVMAVGCEFYRGSQKKACLCRPYGASDTSQDKIRQYNDAKRAREAAAAAEEAAAAAPPPAMAEEDALDSVYLSSPSFDLPEAIDHQEL